MLPTSCYSFADSTVFVVGRWVRATHLHCQMSTSSNVPCRRVRFQLVDALSNRAHPLSVDSAGTSGSVVRAAQGSLTKPMALGVGGAYAWVPNRLGDDGVGSAAYVPANRSASPPVHFVGLGLARARTSCTGASADALLFCVIVHIVFFPPFVPRRFTFVARKPTTVRFELLVDAPRGASDAFFIKVDAGKKTEFLIAAMPGDAGPAQGPRWMRQTNVTRTQDAAVPMGAKGVTVEHVVPAGEHTLHVIGWEDGTHIYACARGICAHVRPRVCLRTRVCSEWGRRCPAACG